MGNRNPLPALPCLDLRKIRSQGQEPKSVSLLTRQNSNIYELQCSRDRFLISRAARTSTCLCLLDPVADSSIKIRRQYN
ncbi:hypothetical protein V6N13_100194 [Hibiscus sabdariffa]